MTRPESRGSRRATWRVADDSLTRGQAAARTIFGRDIKHIMLLHIGGFETGRCCRAFSIS